MFCEIFLYSVLSVELKETCFFFFFICKSLKIMPMDEHSNFHTKTNKSYVYPQSASKIHVITSGMRSSYIDQHVSGNA
jgi:hypothetical protein